MTAEGERPLEIDEIRSRAATGVVSVGVRNVLVRAAGLAGTVVLARLLEPREFGLLALGLTFKLLGSLLASGGLGAELIRREQPPTRDELRCVLAFQLAGTLVLALVVSAVGLAVGGAMAIAGVMTLSLPVAVANTPARILLERSLDWNLLARAEVSATVVFNVGAIGLVLLGAGVWGVAAATIAEAAVVSAILLARGPVGLLRPLFSWRLLKPLLRFGLAFQAVPLLVTGRDQGVNILIAALAGVTALGIWTVASRIFLAITLLLEALWRVSFPAMSRMLERGGDGLAMIENAMKLNALAFGVLAVAVGGTAPALVPTLFGPAWDDAIMVLPWGAAALLLTGALSTAGVGFIAAKAEGGRMVRVFAAEALVWLAATAALVPLLGAQGAGIAMLVSAPVFAFFVIREVRRHVRVRLLRLIWAPTAAAVVAGSVGWLTATQVSPAALGLLASAVAGELVYVLLVFVARREDSIALVRMFLTAANAAFPSLGRLASSARRVGHV